MFPICFPTLVSRRKRSESDVKACRRNITHTCCDSLWYVSVEVQEIISETNIHQHPLPLDRLMHCCGWGVGFQCGWLWDSLPARNSDHITLEDLHEGPPHCYNLVYRCLQYTRPKYGYIHIYVYIYMYPPEISINPFVFSPNLPVGPL